MVTEDSQKIKLCDFGACLKVADDIHPETALVSRFYRAPEIIIGCVPDQAVDVWSAGITLFELFSGRVPFNASTNSLILKQIVL